MKKGVLEMNYSPLRYPGGKSKLTPLVEKLMQSTTFKFATISSETGESSFFGPVLDFCLSKCEVKNQAKHVDSSS